MADYYRYLGKGTTDSNGKAHLTTDASGNTIDPPGLVGVGAGEIDVVASLDNPIVEGSVVSQPYSVTDCLYYDKGLSGTGNYNDAMWQKNSATLERADDGSLFTANVNWASIIVGTTSSPQSVPLPCCIEFDVLEMSEIGDTGPYMEIRKFGASANANIWFANEGIGHHKIELRSNSQTQTINGQSKPSGSQDLGDGVRILIGSTTANGTIKFKNFEVYSI